MNFTAASCPMPIEGAAECVLLAHGEGGSLMRRLIAERIVPCLGNAAPGAEAVPLDDASVLPAISGLPVVTTDAFVVTPLFFPGGDIGRLAVYGTCNDLAVRGAWPLSLTVALVLEEGLPLPVLDRVLKSMAAACQECGVPVVAGDTKVVPRGAADGLFVTTTGIGRLLEPAPAGSGALAVNDALLVSGPIGQHGMAVLTAREQLGFSPPPQSDCGPLFPAVDALRQAGVRPRALRDATRGGVAAVLHEWASDCGLTLAIDEQQLPVTPQVRGACELLGLDPLDVANEGTMVLAVPPEQAEAALAVLRGWPAHALAAQIGRVQPRQTAPVVVRRLLGRQQPLVEPRGAPLPRIC